MKGNAAFLHAHGDALTGGYLCCNFVSFAANGTFLLRFSEADSFSQISVFTARNLETWAVGGVDENSIHSRSWEAGLAAAKAESALLLKAGLMGIIMDYEPADNYTAPHAAAYGDFLEALARAVSPLRVGIDIAAWGILGPSFWPLYANRGVSRFTSMTPTYDAKNVSEDFHFVRQALDYFPPGSFAAGIGSVLSTPKCAGGDFLWTNSTLSPFVAFLGQQSVEYIDVWRCDIDTPYDVASPDPTAPFFLDALVDFLNP
jgi:hypothetical protein